jgi:hypothetical protein
MDDDLWPGNDLVDWVAFDNYGTGVQPTFVTNVGSMYDFLNSTSTADHDYAAKPYALAEWGIHGATVTPQQTYDYSDQATAAVEGNVFANIKAYMIFDNVGPEGTENRVGYQNGGVPDPVRQEHYNAFANSSAFVDPPADTSPPTAVITSPSDQATVTGVVPVTADVGDDRGVTQAQLLVDGTASGAAVTAPGSSVGFSLDTTTLGAGPHTVSVQVQDAAGNTGLSPTVTIDVHVPDVSPPTAPSGLSATVTGSSVDLRWQPSSDNIGVSGYKVLRNGVLLAQTTTTAYTDTTGQQGSTYSYAVQAYDAAGNISASSGTLSKTVPDVTPPATPAQPTVTLNARRTITITWKATTDNVGVTGYQLWRNGVLLTRLSRLTYTDSSVRKGRSYSYQVSAVDAAGNRSAASPSSRTLTIPAGSSLLGDSTTAQIADRLDGTHRSGWVATVLDRSGYPGKRHAEIVRIPSGHGKRWVGIIHVPTGNAAQALHALLGSWFARSGTRFVLPLVTKADAQGCRNSACRTSSRWAVRRLGAQWVVVAP